MAALCNRAAIIFCPVVSFFFLFILTLSQWLQIGCLPYFYTWCGPSANLECRSEMCCTHLEMQDAKKIAKNLPPAPHRTTLSGYVFTTKAAIDSQEKLVKQQYLPHMSPQYGELWPKNVTFLWFTVYIFRRSCPVTGFCHVQNSLCIQVLHSPILAAFTALEQWASGKVCGIVQGMELQNFQRGHHLYSTGRPSRWASAHILTLYSNCLWTVSFYS